MAKIWKNRLVAGTQVFAECPDKYKDDVIALLKEDVKEGEITAEQYKDITGEDYK